MPRFYTTNIDLAINQEIVLESSLVSHIHVLRFKANQPVILFNGDGYNYHAVITMLTRNLAKAYIKDKSTNTSGTSDKLKINLAICLIANDRMDIVVQKATELGVAQITPVISKFSQRINPERLKNRLLHWQKIIISACEQCGRSTLAKIHMPVNFSEIVSDTHEMTYMDSSRSLSQASVGIGNDKLAYTKIICNQHNDDSEAIKLSSTANNLMILVGPEGGFSKEESTQAAKSGFISLQLGANILRAETASIASISSLRTMLHKW